MSAAAELPPVLSEAMNLSPAQVLPDTPEFDLLVACCADSSTRGHSDRIRRVLSHPLNWERMLDMADHHRVVPQVYGQLAAFRNLIPASQFDALRTRYQHNARKALWFTGELVRILGHFESLGIEALPYKGPILARTLYREVTERQFGDLDVLVRSADVPRARAALLELGYRPGIELAPHQTNAYTETGYEYSFSAVNGSNLLELQWQILPRFYSIDFDVPESFRRAVVINLDGVANQLQSRTSTEPAWNGREAAAECSPTVRTLCAQDLLLVLCVHAAKHVWIQLSWLCDIAQLAKSPQLDWDAIQDDAQRLGIERIVILNLLLAHRLLGPPLPRAIEERLRQDPSATILADEILLVIERSVHYDTESIPYFRLMMRLRERWQDRARFLWRLIFTPGVSEWSAVQFPKSLQPLYRLVRLSRLAKRLGVKSLQLFFF